MNDKIWSSIKSQSTQMIDIVPNLMSITGDSKNLEMEGFIQMKHEDNELFEQVYAKSRKYEKVSKENI